MDSPKLALYIGSLPQVLSLAPRGGLTEQLSIAYAPSGSDAPWQVIQAGRKHRQAAC